MDPENTPDNTNAGKKSLRLVRPSIIVLCGPAGCGKSTFAEQHFRTTQIISSDWARARVADDERDQRYNLQAFALVHFLIEQRLTLNRLCVVDSTALTPLDRKELVGLARKYQVPTTLLVFNVPLQTCIERDEKRERSVGRPVVERQYQAFEQSKEAIPQEGFDQVVVFKDGDQEKVQIEILFRPVARQPQRPERPDSGAHRRIERPTQSPQPRHRGSGGNGHPVSATVPPVAPLAASTRLAGLPASVPTPKAAAPRVGETPAQVVQAQPPTSAHPPASPAAADPLGVRPQTVASPKPSPAAAPGTLPVAPENSGGK